MKGTHLSTGGSKHIVVIGNGMVGHRFCEKLVAYDVAQQYRIITFCEEPRAAYDRVGLTSFFAHRDAEKLSLAKIDWYKQHGIALHLGDRANQIERQARVVRSQQGIEIHYDAVVLATGSYPFVPPVPGINKLGVFVYRTIDDLERIMAYARKVKRAAVIGGGLLGLEAAKAAYDLGLETHVVEFAPRLMPRQIDDTGSRLLVRTIEDLGVTVHLNKATEEVLGNGKVQGMRFKDDETLDVDMIIVSAGIRPRDDLGRDCGLEIGERGGIVVNDHLQTSDASIYAIGEVALHGGTIYGLVAPGYEMADVVARHLTGTAASFTGTDLSTKLKLMGIDVASFGDYEAGPQHATPLTWEDPFDGVYKKLLFNHDGSRLLGGILVGDASAYGSLSVMAKSNTPLPCRPQQLILGSSGSTTAPGGVEQMPDSAQICSCNNVSKAAICNTIRDQQLTTIGDVKAATRAGTGCGGCLPLVTDLFNSAMASAGITISRDLCPHFAYSRTELFALLKVRQLKTFDDILAQYGSGDGCEICKPAITSILAALWNEHILNPAHQTLQDTNDRFLANIQRGGSYSVVPRIPGGEITPDKLIALGKTAKAYGLYTKITGAQRIDLFGAQLQDLPGIWETLINAGFESGHAYGKALRTIKSCVGTTWCRYGVQDSVGFAIRLENRYKGIRAPHKLKGAVSGCVRECAEAQGKDFGLVATENGYNLYVCGNGGARPRHADLLAADISEATAIRYLDRFLMYYIMTADKLTRTAVWHLKDVIIEDKLGICDELERMLQYLVDSYTCEWTEVLQDPEKRKQFRQFVNTDTTESCIELITERGQQRPANWPNEATSMAQRSLLVQYAQSGLDPVRRAAYRWVNVGTVSDFPHNGGATIKYGKVQIAVYNFSSRAAWYASQQMCPHKKAFVLSRGIIGDANGIAKIACPLHKKTFSLESGECLSGDDYTVQVFEVKVEGEQVYLNLPPTEVLDRQLATAIGCRLATACNADDASQPVLV
jgi:NAD(P)H-dependent nitrite reductase large subunit/NAD(P)H-dependent nitrite reductase small subunit